MSSWNRGLGRRVVATLVALLVGLFGFASAANAAPDFGNIDPDAKGSLTIHKHEHQSSPADQAPDGSSADLGSPIEGVTFTVYPVQGIDLTQPEAWDGLDGLQPGANCTAPDGYTLGTGTQVTTGADGVASLGDLPVGLYQVCETDAPENVVQRAAPFLVSIPFPYQDGWLYDVHVYPKNAVGAIEKEVEAPNGLGLGSVVTFPVTTTVPQIAPGDTLTSYVVEDVLDNRLGDIGVSSVTIDGADVDASYYDVVIEDQRVRVIFNAEGLEWLSGQPNKQIVTKFYGTVERLGDGTIENVAVVFINDPNMTNGVHSNDVNTNWGDVVVAKTDATDTGLAGAVFEVYEAAAPYAGTCTSKDIVGDAISVNGETQFTSDANGRINIAGLYVSDSSNDPINAEQRCYVLKEVQAPAGFVTPEGDAGLFPVAVKIGATSGVDITIENMQQDGPELPLTGSAGALLMTILGLGMVVVAGTLIVVSRRKAAEH